MPLSTQILKIPPALKALSFHPKAKSYGPKGPFSGFYTRSQRTSSSVMRRAYSVSTINSYKQIFFCLLKIGQLLGLWTKGLAFVMLASKKAHHKNTKQTKKQSVFILSKVEG